MFAPLPVPADGALESESSEGLVDAELEMFTVTLTLSNLETREGVSFLTVKTPQEETLVLEAAEYCQFIDDRRRILSPSDFGKLYRGRKITIDFTERGPGLYVVEECRAGTK
jgi:hypothetical protein